MSTVSSRCWQLLQGSVLGISLLLSVLGERPAIAANWVSPIENRIYAVSDLEDFAQTGRETATIREIVSIKPEYTAEDMQKGLNRIIDVDFENIHEKSLDDLKPRDKADLKLLYPELDDELYRVALRRIGEMGNETSVISFIRAFPVETITTANFFDIITAPFDDPDPTPEPDPDPDPPKAERKNILWYGQLPSYEAAIRRLAEVAETFDPLGNGNTPWDLTFWNQRDEVAPDFSQYDALVIGSAFNIPPHGFAFNAQRLFDNKQAIQAARGDRTLLTGLDADIHYMLPHRGQSVANPGNFLINTVNWAASGTGLGIVSLTDGNTAGPFSPNGSRWWLNEGSFLKDELEGSVEYGRQNIIAIHEENTEHDVHEGLTASNLSNWKNSAHVVFNPELKDYCGINHSTAQGKEDWSTTVTSGKCEKVPEPATVLGLLGMGVVLVITQRNRKAE